MIRLSHENKKVVRLLDPSMCLSCRFSQMAEVEIVDGGKQRMIYCQRLDCDNWDTSSTEVVTNVQVHDDEAA